MPAIRIPIYQEQVQETGLPGYRQRLEYDRNAVASVGEGIERLAKGGTMLAAKEIEKHDSAVLMDAYTRAGQLRLKHEAAFTDQKGKDALAGADKAKATFVSELDKIGFGLATDRQREAWARIRAQNALGFEGVVTRHVSQEGEHLAATAYEGAQVTTAQDAAAAATAGDGARLVQARSDLLDAVSARASQLGLEGDAREAMQIEATTKFHAAALDAMTEGGRWKEAEDYLKEHRTEIDARALKRLKDGVRAAGIRGQSLELSTKVIEGATEGEFEFDLGKATKAAGELTRGGRNIRESNPDLYDAIVDRLEHQAHQVELARRANDTEKLGRIEQVLRSGVRRVNRHSPDYLALSETGKASALAMERANKNAGTKAQNKRDRIIRYRYLQQEYPTQRDLDIDSDPLTRDASLEEREYLKTIQRKVIDQNGVNKSAFDRLIDGKADELGLTKSSRSGKADRERFRRLMRERFIDWSVQPENQRKLPSPQETKEWFDEATRKVIVERGLLGLDKEIERWQVQPGEQYREPWATEEQLAAPFPAAEPQRREPAAPQVQLRWPSLPPHVQTIDDVPVDAIPEIMKSWRAARGTAVDPTAAQLIEAYNRMQRGMR